MDMEVFQNIMIVFLTVLLLGILISFSILLEKFMELSDEVHKKLFEMSVENNTNMDDGFILGDEFLTEDELMNESNENSGEEFGVYIEY
jgi:hypothetical protein